MSPHHRFRFLVVLVLAATTQAVFAEEPNEFFGESTVLAPGVLSVDDDLVAGVGGTFPDTMVASLNTAGFRTDFNNDGGPWEGSLGSSLTYVPINNDSSFWFLVTGFDDFDFQGNHDQSGNYHVYVDVYDDFDILEGTFEFDGTLQPNEVDQFSMDGFNTNYTYDVYIDNTVGGSSAGDVDFFTFTGLNPGASFSAETMELGFTEIDTYLGWFDDFGNLLEVNDDIDTNAGNYLSIIEGTVPASGKLTFAVTGYGDDDFLGYHDENAEYSLQLTIGGSEVTGDFDGDGDIDGRDFLIWQRGGSPNSLSAGDLAAWQENYGVGTLSTITVPEPTTVGLLALAACATGLCRNRKR